MQETLLLSRGQCEAECSTEELILHAKYNLHFFNSFFAGPTADKTCFVNLEELKTAHKVKHHSSIVGLFHVALLIIYFLSIMLI